MLQCSRARTEKLHDWHGMIRHQGNTYRWASDLLITYMMVGPNMPLPVILNILVIDLVREEAQILPEFAPFLSHRMIVHAFARSTGLLVFAGSFISMCL